MSIITNDYIIQLAIFNYSFPKNTNFPKRTFSFHRENAILTANMKEGKITMKYNDLRNELKSYYLKQSIKNAEKRLKEASERLDALYDARMSSYEMKALQYDVISDIIEPVLFQDLPFYYETGIVPGCSDGARNFRGYKNAGGWTYWKNQHLFIDQDKELWDLRCRQCDELLYLICGAYNDTDQHFQFNHRPILQKGIKGVYEDVEKQLALAETNEEKAFLSAVCSGLLSVKKICEKFADKAEKMLQTDPENKNYKRIAESARRAPWEKPQNFFEALNVYALMRKVIGSLEGIGPNSFGRLDMDLYPFYEADIEAGTLTKEEAYELISKFLIMFDCHYDHDQKMVGYADHELENTYVLGGCDANGNPVYNELTKMFLNASYEERIIFPKIKCRFSKNSPREYMEELDRPIINGTSTILYENDDTVIPALVKSGITLEDARDYLASGCWDIEPNAAGCQNCGNYTNLLKAFEYQIYNCTDKMQKVNMFFAPIDEAESFEEVYKITCRNMDVLFAEKARVLAQGGQVWHKVDPLPLFSSTYKDCVKNKRDYTNKGTRYKDDTFSCFGFPDIIDSLMAIKTLCFDEKKYTLKQFLAAVRSNWQGYDAMRYDAVHCSGWGDGKKESCTLAARFNTDLYNMLSKHESIYGGRINLGYLTYTEIRFWGEKTLATPNGRYNGDYIAQGLTPSRLKKIPYVTSVINSLAALDKETMAGNNVVNIILPGTTSSAVCEAFLRTASDTALEALQLNCVSKDTLLDAQKHPEKYPDLIVRVCGFSAKFTSLSPEWQKEVLTRNFYQ